jgi:hypothetical protein
LLASQSALGCDLTIHKQPQMPDGRVEVIRLSVTHGYVSALRKAPIGWRFTADNDPSWITSTVGIAIVGAADLDPDDLSAMFSITPEDGLSCENLIKHGDLSVVLTLAKFNEPKGRRYRVDRSALELHD